AFQWDSLFADDGAAFVFHGSPSGITSLTPATAQGSLTLGSAYARDSAYFGISVAGTGDVNGDGYDDVLVGASGVIVPMGSPNGGLAASFLGGKFGLGTQSLDTPHQVTRPFQGLSGSPGSCEYGLPVAGAGDVNGDGYADAVVGGRGCYDG